MVRQEIDPAIPFPQAFRRIGNAVRKPGPAGPGIDRIAVAQFQKRLYAVRKAPIHDPVEPGDIHLAFLAFAFRPPGQDSDLAHAQRLQIVAVLVEVHEVAVNRRAVEREVRGADLAHALRTQAADLLQGDLQRRRVAVGPCPDQRRHGVRPGDLGRGRLRGAGIYKIHHVVIQGVQFRLLPFRQLHRLQFPAITPSERAALRHLAMMILARDERTAQPFLLKQIERIAAQSLGKVPLVDEQPVHRVRLGKTRAAFARFVEAPDRPEDGRVGRPFGDKPPAAALPELIEPLPAAPPAQHILDGGLRGVLLHHPHVCIVAGRLLLNPSEDIGMPRCEAHHQLDGRFRNVLRTVRLEDDRAPDHRTQRVPRALDVLFAPGVVRRTGYDGDVRRRMPVGRPLNRRGDFEHVRRVGAVRAERQRDRTSLDGRRARIERLQSFVIRHEIDGVARLPPNDARAPLCHELRLRRKRFVVDGTIREIGCREDRHRSSHHPSGKQQTGE